MPVSQKFYRDLLEQMNYHWGGRQKWEVYP